MKNKNIGQTGLKSIRIDGNEIGNIPLGQGNEAKMGLADFIKTDKETKQNNIAARFPKHKIKFLQSQVRECRSNITKIKEYKVNLRNQIAEYRQIIKDCLFRETELSKYDKDNPDDKSKMKDLRLKYPPYSIDALNQQIIQFEEGIERCDGVIEQDFESINEIETVLALVQQRERELRNT